MAQLAGRTFGPPADDPRPAVRYQWLARLFMGLFLVTVLGAVGYAVWRDREVQLEQQLARAQGNVLIFEDEIGQTLQLVENTLRALPEVSGEPLASASPQWLYGVLRRLQHSQPALRSLSILDSSGRVRASSQPNNLGAVIDTLGFLPADRATGESSVLRVGPVWEGRDIGEARPTLAEQPGDPAKPYFVPLLLRMGEGDEAVWLVAALNPDYLLGRMERFHRPDSDRVHVARLDGRVLFSTDDSPNGGPYPFDDLLPDILTHELGTDEGDALSAYRTLKAYPLFVSVRVDRLAVLADWRRKSAVIGLVTLLGLASVLAGYLWLMRRVRAGEQAEALQQATIVRLSQALEQSPSGMLIVNDQGRIEYSNPFLRQMTGYSAAELQGRTPALLDGGRVDKARYLAVLAQLKAGHIWRGELLRRRRDGQVYPAHVVAAPLRDVSGHITHFVSVEHDLTQEKRTLAELAQARDHAEAATRAKSAFLANMSHEIRTPMNGVIGMVSLLLDSRLDPEQRDQAQTIRESAESLLHLIDDILDFSKVEAGKLVLASAALSPAELCRTCARRLQVTAQGKGLRLALALADDVPPAVLGDAQRLQQVLVNLLGNAIKFTAAGQVVLRLQRLAPACTSDTGAEPGATLRFEVQDEGIGIAPEAQQQLFQPFTQVDSSSSRAFGGTGLGLSISRQLVEAMGGRIGVHSAPGAGATFWFELTLPLASPVVAPLSSHPAPAVALPRLTGRVLLVEDQPVNQKLALAVLGRVGLEAVLAQNGREALDRLRAERFNLVLMDCQMPVMDGFEATERLRAGEAGEAAQTVPVLALTANVMAEDLERCRASGFDGHVPKPFTMKGLHAALVPWLPATSTEAAAS
ncbi:ATP-binding protein [Hydrogenophaga defluvii]|uniref:histidine kinase n=1 Tax=Hydrogenophaga defluvii TaxID=249410 RepID=A0ABW2S9R0_9BURK